MGNVVDDQQAASVCHLTVVPVVSLQKQTKPYMDLNDTGNRTDCMPVSGLVADTAGRELE